MRFWQGTIYGEAASKANRKRLVRIGGFSRLIKSAEALSFEAAVMRQTPILNPMLQGRLKVTAKIYYSSNRADLDASVLLDAMQNRIYKNDRQCREQHFVHDIDKMRPRCVVRVEEISELPL